MGLTYHDARRLWQVRLDGGSFENTLTCSHLQLFLHPEELDAFRRAFTARQPEHTVLANYKFGDYADAFCREFLDTQNLETMDYSAYEGATIVHDLNTPVPESLHGQFDAVIEAGSLEHIFNFPMAVRNLMRMVKVGGRIFLTTVANNFCGHGFYQFSPELMYRIFSPENGFETISVVFLEGTFAWVELTPMRGVYRVADPMNVRARVGLLSEHPILMMVDARKLSDVEPFRSNPQQSDYVATWSKGEDQVEASRNGTAKKLVKAAYKALPLSWQKRIQGHRTNALYNLRNKEFYRKLP